MRTAKKEISATHLSLLTQHPTIMLGHPVFNQHNQLSAVLLAEIDLQPIEAIRSSVRFGQHGHSAIIDNKGQALAHPNPEWTTSIKDLSGLSIVKNVLAGKTGVINFYSPHLRTEMIAGYTGIKDLGWGVMVPQPKSEIDSAVASTLYSLLIWAVLGVIIAVIAAYYLSGWISHPLNRLARKAQQINHNEDILNLKNLVQSAPCEVVVMANAMQTLINDLRHSNQEISKLNDSLQDQINKATSDLQHANNNLQQLASSDHLTTIANRRFFENSVSDILGQSDGKSIGIMLVDIDNFISINDRFGHAAGDYVLTTVAELLRKAMRPGDIIARYGGDEFVAEFESDVKIIQKRAEDLRDTVENHRFNWHQQNLTITLSIGIICHKTSTSSSLDQLMSIADDAMYQAKNSGRNQVALIAS